MNSTLGLDPKTARMLRDYGHIPTRDEAEAAHILPRHHRFQPRTWYNAGVSAVLRSPLHRLLSQSVMLLTFCGHQSGRFMTTPVNYVSARGGILYTLSKRERKWWHNLEGGAPVTVRVRGKDYSAFASTITEPKAVARELDSLIKRVPGYAAPLQIGWTDVGEPNPADLERLAQQYIVICTQLHV